MSCRTPLLSDRSRDRASCSSGLEGKKLYDSKKDEPKQAEWNEIARFVAGK